MPEYVINSDVSLQQTLGNLRELYRTDKYVRVKATVGTKRSLDQNAIGHAFYEQVARELSMIANAHQPAPVVDDTRAQGVQS